MKFAELAANLDQMEATSSRNELVRILSDVYRACSVDELEPITYLIQGRLAPFFEPVEIGLGPRLLINAIAAAYGAPQDQVSKLNRQNGDLGVTAEGLAPASDRESPSVVEVHERLSQIAAAGGEGSQQKSSTASQLCWATGCCIRQAPRANHARQDAAGIGDRRAGCHVVRQEGRPVTAASLEAAYNRTSDLGLIARTLWQSAETGLEALKVKAGIPSALSLRSACPTRRR